MPALDEFGFPEPRLNAPTAAPPLPENPLDRLIAQQDEQQKTIDLRAAGDAASLIKTPPRLPDTSSQYDEYFGSPRTPRQLREKLSLDELSGLASKRKFDLEQEALNAPLQNKLLQARIDATGAHQRFLDTHDQQTLSHTAGFLNHLSDPNAPKPNDPGYEQHVIQGLLQNPSFAETKGGQEVIKQIIASHQTQSSIEQLKKQLPPGFDVQSVEIGGGKQSHIVARRADTAKELKAGYGLTPDEIQNPVGAMVGNYDPATKKFTNDNKGNVVDIDRGPGLQPVLIPTQVYEQHGGKYSAATAAARSLEGDVSDLDSLARKALQDPNASKAAQDAARKQLSKPGGR